MELSISVRLNTNCLKGKEKKLVLMEIVIEARFKAGGSTALGFVSSTIQIGTKEILLITKCVGEGFTTTQMGIGTRGSLKTTKSTEEGRTT